MFEVNLWTPLCQTLRYSQGRDLKNSCRFTLRLLDFLDTSQILFLTIRGITFRLYL